VTFDTDAIIALLKVVAIDVTLAGDNAIVVGLAVRGLPARQRRIAILTGIIGAAVIRILLALVASRLLAIIGLTLAGGLLLLWVCYRMYREMRASHGSDDTVVPPTSLRSAIVRIILADLSMSLDNVLAVAGAALGHPWVMISGLALSVILMGVAAELIARLLERYRWIGWVGLLIVLIVAVQLIWRGGGEVWHHVT